MTTLTVRAGPFSIFFTNINRKMGLRGHSHFATVDLYYRADAGEDSLGFPSFACTHAAIQICLNEFCAKVFRDHTNERVAREMFAALATFEHADIARWAIPTQLVRLDLNVRGVPDALGHADSFTTYTVQA